SASTSTFAALSGSGNLPVLSSSWGNFGLCRLTLSKLAVSVSTGNFYAFSDLTIGSVNGTALGLLNVELASVLRVTLQKNGASLSHLAGEWLQTSAARSFVLRRCKHIASSADSWSAVCRCRQLEL